MNRKAVFGMVLLVGLSLGAFAQSDTGGIKQDTKNAGHSTAQATKKSGKKVKRGTKKVVHKGAHQTKKGAGKVESKTKPSPSPAPQ